jgi:hypothetical protein
MYPREPLHICEGCDIRHYDNCPDCWGFGVYDAADTRNGVVPVPAAAACGGHRHMPSNARACPTCHSTAAGIPKGQRDESLLNLPPNCHGEQG